VLVELPRPWHDRDPRQLSGAAAEEPLSAQTNNVAWARSELLQWFLAECGRRLDTRDELAAKNERFMARITHKMFLLSVTRSAQPLRPKAPKDVCFLSDSGLFVVATTSAAALLNLQGFADDAIVYNERFAIDAPRSTSRAPEQRPRGGARQPLGPAPVQAE